MALVAVSVLPGHTAAQANDPALKAKERCNDGFLWRETVQGDLVVNDTSCHVINSVILGKVNVTNSPTFALLDSAVSGKVTITGGADTDAAIKDSVVSGDIVIKQVTGTVFVDNVQVLSGDNITIKNSFEVLVINNTVPTGDLKCTGNEQLTAFGKRRLQRNRYLQLTSADRVHWSPHQSPGINPGGLYAQGSAPRSPAAPL